MSFDIRRIDDQQLTEEILERIENLNIALKEAENRNIELLLTAKGKKKRFADTCDACNEVSIKRMTKVLHDQKTGIMDKRDKPNVIDEDEDEG